MLVIGLALLGDMAPGAGLAGGDVVDITALVLATAVIAAAQIIGWLLGVTLWWYLTRYAKWLR